ncbi:MAG TPA: hypothetical protein VIJ14_08690, partial [Rhabdochlamydiaceae bacterium]
MGAKKVTEEIVKERIFNKHGDTVSLKENTFISTHKPAIFIDRDFGEWSCSVKSVMKGTGHPKRWASRRSFDEDRVRSRVFEAHGNIVKLKEGTYTNAKNKATFIDKDFGEWECTAILVWRGHGHPKRADLAHRKSLDEINDRILTVHKGMVSLIASTYTMVTREATFTDSELGQFKSLVNS